MTKQEEIKGWLEHNFHETNARVILDYLHSQGVVIKVERELPNMRFIHGYQAFADVVEREGLVAVEPLIEEA